MFCKYCDSQKIGNASLNLYQNETGSISDESGKTIFGFASITELINEIKSL